MKKTITFIAMAMLAFGLCSAQKVTINTSDAKKSYGNKITITPKDSSVTIAKDTITFAPKKQGSEYTISGYFDGQLINKTKNTVLKLKDAYLENTSGAPAVYGEAKTEISTTKGTTNYIVSTGNGTGKTAALQSKKNLEVGGGGTLYVVGNVYHAIKGDDVKLKGSGTLYAEATQKGSAINCKTLTVESGKTFNAYLINSKNGIKADNTITIASGNFFLYDNETALKTDTAKDAPDKAHGITLTGGTIHTHGNKTLYETENNAYKAKGAKIVEE